MRPRSMEEGKVGRVRCASAADLAAERAVPETVEAEAVVLDDEGATTTEDCGRTLAAFIVCVSIAPDPIVSNCEGSASSSTRCDATRHSPVRSMGRRRRRGRSWQDPVGRCWRSEASARRRVSPGPKPGRGCTKFPVRGIAGRSSSVRCISIAKYEARRQSLRWLWFPLTQCVEKPVRMTTTLVLPGLDDELVGV